MPAVKKDKGFSFADLKRLFIYVRPYRRKFYGSLLLAIILSAITPVRPYLIQITIEKATQPNTTTPAFLKWLFLNIDLHDVTNFIIAITIFQVIFLLVESFLRFTFTFITAWMGQAVVKDLRVSVFKKVLGLQLRQFDRTPIGTLTTRTINDIESINNVFADGLIPIIADLLSIVIILITMFVTDWRLTLIALVPFPFLLWATYYFKESVNKSYIRVRNAVAALNAFVQEHLTGMMIVQAFSAEKREQGKFQEINKEHRNANIRSIFAYSIFFPIVEIVLAISMGLLVWWLAGKAANNPIANENLAGKLVSFILYLNLIFRPLRVIADKFNVLQMGLIASERVFKVLDNKDEIPPALSNALSADNIKGQISFEKVWFAYTDEHFVLKNISFDVKAGETIALVGHTGSGKTSIISLINRMYPIYRGEIKIDGQNINDYDLDSLRRKIGVVLQDVFLFSGSILDNITLRSENISQEQVEAAAKLIGVHDFIMQFPGGYHYKVMERGNTLSMGQRQLISFIRALLYDPTILILDEATSSIDSESEVMIQHAIETLISGRTSIVIAHRLSTIRKADKIIVLDKGEIKETGTHDELLAQKGMYEKLYHLQFEKKQNTAPVS